MRSPDGERLVTDLNFDKAHYREESIGVAVGDRLRWSKNDAQLQRRNGQEFEIESTVGHLANIKYRDGRTEAIDLRQAHHFDLAIATTIYSSQGKTSDLVLVAADGVQNSESFYVAASRAKSELKIFTDSPDNLRSMVMESMSNRNPRELLSDLDRRQAILKAQKQHGVRDRHVLQVEVEPLLDNVNEREDELDRQESVKVPTHGGSVKVPTHGGDVGTLTSREDELDTNPVR